MDHLSGINQQAAALKRTCDDVRQLSSPLERVSMPSKRPKKRVKLAVDTIDTTDNIDNTSTSNSNGSRGDMAPVEKSHHPPSPPLLQQPIHYQQQHYQQQYQQYAQYQHQQSYHPYQLQGYFVALPTDLELLEDFCAYLENRVLTKNLALLRCMLTEFLSRQELTLAQFKCFGANLIAVLPFDVLDQTKRAHADLLLQKKKHALADQTCAFEFLFARVATKNLAMLRQMFIEFRTHKESSIHEFVKLGVAAISIVPYDPPHVSPVERFAYTAPYASQSPYLPNQFGVLLPISQQLQHQYTPQSYQHQYQPPQHAYYSQQQQHYAPQLYQHHQHEHQPQYDRRQQGDSMGVPGVMPKHERAKKIPTGSRKSYPAQDLSVRLPVGSKAAVHSAGSSNKNSNSSSSDDAGASVVGKRVVKKPVRYYKEQEEELVAAVAKSSKRFKREQLATAAACEAGFMPSSCVKSRKVRKVDAKANRKSKKKQKASNTYSNNKTSMVMMDLDFSYSKEELEDDEELELHELELQKQLSKTNSSGNKRMLDSMIDETLRQFEEHAEAEQRKLELKHRKMERQRLQDESKEAPLRKQATAEPRIARNGSAGWARVDDTALQIKTIVRDKLCKFEARQPWKQVFRDLPLPFDEQKAPRLADQLRLFWRVHARAVWERNFWVPLVQDGDVKANVARKGRQRLACIMFNAVVCNAFKAFGAEFFLKLDAERHPGWWYRGPILDILAFHRVVGDKKCWAFVESQLCERFPDCGLELPLKTPNYGVLRHKSESAAMWSNAPKTALILSKIVELKERRARTKLVGDGGDGDSNPSPSSNNPDASVEKEEDEGGGSEAVEVVGRDGSGQTGGNVPADGHDADIGDVAGAIDDDDDHGEDMILPLTTNTDAADDENESDKDEEEELLIEKIALASSLEADDTVLLTTAQGAAKTTASEGESPVDASAIGDEGAIATVPDGDEIAAEESGAKAVADGEIAASGTTGTGEIATSVSDKNAGMAAGGALAQELKPARFTEFIPFGDGE